MQGRWLTTDAVSPAGLDDDDPDFLAKEFGALSPCRHYALDAIQVGTLRVSEFAPWLTFGAEIGHGTLRSAARTSEVNHACVIFGISRAVADESLLRLGADVYLSSPGELASLST